MKRIISLAISIIITFSLFGCSNNKTVQDDSPITFYVALGNNAAYYNRLKEVIKENLGYDVQFIFQTAVDTSTAAELEFKNNDLPADIFTTAKVTNEEYLKDSALDLMNYTKLADYFTYQKLTEITNDDGSIYQLPYTTRLIGITYNETLMNEMGWEVPSTYEDMLELKQKCDENNILFAVSAMCATGHGFNYLFYTMGAQWLSTIEGSKWFSEFLSGETDVTAFKEEADYFNDWVNSGLFGKAHTEDWNASKEYCSRRALFYYDLTNTVYSYEGDIVDEQGNVIGYANDTYKTIPWISRDGSNNCYINYDSMYVALNKKLADPDQADKLKKCIEILEFMTTTPVTDIFKEQYLDGYVAVEAFEIDDSRLYADYEEKISNGYTIPWYYASFDTNTIVSTGECINNYISNGTSSIDEIFDTLQNSRNERLNNSVPTLCTFAETLSYEEIAEINGICALNTYADALKENGISETPDFALIPYIENIEELMPFSAKGVVSTKAYKGVFTETDAQTIVPAKGQNVVGVYMTGNELKEAVSTGLAEEDYTYKFALVGDGNIDDNETYLVVVSKVNYASENYIEKEGTVISVNIVNSVAKYLADKYE